ncbi:TPA: hypothetical protein ACGQTC_003100 [Citrobacter braakii]|nr:MAG TPA: hypothetical protein [Caudoviricetes sp.]
MQDSINLGQELAISLTQETVSDLGLNLAIHFLDDTHGLEIEQKRGLVLNWRDWFRDVHYGLKNRFSLAVSSKGKPPVVIGAAVYSYDLSAKQVSIHMLEHFKNTLPESDLNKRMGFVSLTAAFAFARFVNASTIKIINPLQGAVPYYAYLGFVHESDAMVITVEKLREKLSALASNRGEHGYEWSEEC